MKRPSCSGNDGGSIPIERDTLDSRSIYKPRWRKRLARTRMIPGSRPIATVLLAILLCAGGWQAGAEPPAAEGLAGKLLVATEAMPDPRFAETVIYMVEHNASGAMGLVVNRPLGEVPFTDLLEGLGLENEGVSGDVRVHYGGPVEARRGFVLHSPDYTEEGTKVIDGSVALTSKLEIVRAIASGVGPRQSLVVFGYAAWSPGQLEGEMKAGGWITVPSDAALVFGDDYEDKWRRAMDRRSIDL